MKPFRDMGTNLIIDPISYIQDLDIKDLRIYVGTDSQNVYDHTVYATVIFLHFGNRGGRILYSRERVKRIRDTYSRLWNEVERSIEVSNILRDGGINVEFIDMDINISPKHRSNQILTSALGYVESQGFVPRIKPYAPVASCCADALCH